MAEQDVKVTLYWLDQSRSQRILWLLEELKITYDVKVFHRDKTTKLAPPELAKVHPLGKSPVITITPPYLCEHFPEGKRIVPKRWKDGMEGKIGGETEEWLRHEYYLHYTEGSLMPFLVMSLVISQLKSPSVPFYLRPITSGVADRMYAGYVFPNVKKNLEFLEGQLKSSSGRYLCSDQLTAADVLMSFPLMGGKERFDNMGQFEGGSWKNAFPRVLEYIELLENEEGYKRSVAKIEEIDGQFAQSL
ncbi:Glutathione S-transferase 1-like protein [Cladobotryum mycophilum]|uniref:Glutathione S-transferase 1-like protein n=1 Tax=Cladobotryum mycophilum TaxID=491253 RepID=A0ABR0SZ87_9HYPO